MAGVQKAAMSKETNKQLVRRLVEEVVNRRDPEPLHKLAHEEFAALARRWISPFRSAFPDFTMEVVELVAEGDTVVARFRCSGTYRGVWRGHSPTGRRFERIDEVYFFTIDDGRITAAWGLEDTARRLRQLGLPR
jgi:predicted ester cyclase